MRYGVRRQTLPLAVYREVVAHVMQVAGVEAMLAESTSSSFDYSHSQVEALWIQHDDALDPQDQAQVAQILAYYGDRYGPWETLNSP